jgi:hypothetical protein
MLADLSTRAGLRAAAAAFAVVAHYELKRLQVRAGAARQNCGDPDEKDLIFHGFPSQDVVKYNPNCGGAP